MPRPKNNPNEAPGAFPYQFLTGSHPDEFKDSSTRQKVRSQVMKDFRRRQTRSPDLGSSSHPRSRSRTSRPYSRFAVPSLLVDPVRPPSPTSQHFLQCFPPCEHLAESQIRLGLAASSHTNNLPCYVHPSIRDRGFCFACLSCFTDTYPSHSGPHPSKQDRLALLSSVCSEISRRDLLLQASGKSRASLAIESDIIQTLNSNLALSDKPDGASDHEIILAVTYLIISETMHVSLTRFMTRNTIVGHH